MEPQISSRVLRFGIFEADISAGELRKQGRRIKLQDLPFQFLAVLIECPGQVVSRDELAARLWSRSALIDVDNGLNTAARKLRLALGDDADTPRFIETLPRRGYRFIAAVEAVPIVPIAVAANAGAAITPPLPSIPKVAEPDTSLDRTQVALETVAASSQHFRLRTRPVLAVLLLLLGGWFLIPRRFPAALRTVQLTHTGGVEQYAPIVSDGQRLYFVQREGGMWSLAQVPVEGGTPSPVEAPRGVAMLQALSPNRSELLVNIGTSNEDETPFWIIPTVNGSVRRVGNVTGHSGAWSPDGRTIIYASGSALYRMSADGTDSRKLVDTPGIPNLIQWSPANRVELVRFTLQPEGSLWQCAPDGSGLQRFEPARLANAGDGLAIQSGVWTRDGKYYIFDSSNEHGTTFWAYRESPPLLHPFDRRLFQIYSSPVGTGLLAPSLDGKKIFFGTGKETRELVAFDSKRDVFLPFLSGRAIRNVDFSKDRLQVAYETIPEGALWRSRADGTERMQLTAPQVRVSNPRWSPDGQRIVFEGGYGLTKGVFAMPAAGGPMERIGDANAFAASPSWSPDGQKLMYSCATSTGNFDVCVLDWKTHVSEILPGCRGLLRPAWSPDGRYIAALRDSGTQVVLYDLESHRSNRLADGGGYGIPFWSRDGRFIYFQEVVGSVDQPIFRVKVATRSVERLMSSQQLPQSSFTGYTLTGLTPDDQPIATVLRRNGDLYALDIDLP